MEDDNVMRILQMLQDGKITAQEAETLIAALRGAQTGGASKPAQESGEDAGPFPPFDRFKSTKLDLDDLGERISRAVSRIQPDRILKRVQSQLRTATRSSAHWGAAVSARVKTWAEGEDARPSNAAGWPEHADTETSEFHLEPAAFVSLTNPLGDVKVTAADGDTATMTVNKTAWAPRQEDLRAVADAISVDAHGTDNRLEVKVSAPEGFHDGTADLEVKVPRSASCRVSAQFGSVEIVGIDGKAEAATTSGDVEFRDLGGDARGETHSGDMRIDRVAGTVTVASQSGDITAEDVRRGLTANTASGDVRATGLEGGRVECKSVSGDVTVERVGVTAPLDMTVESVSGDACLRQASGSVATKAVSGDVTLEDVTTTRLQAQTVSGDVQVSLREAFSGTMQVNTVSGDVTIGLPDGSNVRLSLGTTSGELQCEPEAHDVTATDTLWTGQIGTGAGTISVQTISGDTRIGRANSAASEASHERA